MKVVFVGAGPGAPDLITVRGRDFLSRADIVIYAGSLVNPELLAYAPEAAEIYNSAPMDLDEVTAVYLRNREAGGIIVRLHTGDPSLYGAVQEQIDFCKDAEIPFEVVPGVSSFFAAAAALGQEFTLPGVSQSLILTRLAGRTPVPDSEDLAELARHRTSMAVFLSAGNLDGVVEKLKTGYPEDTPAAVVYRASWPDQKIVTGNLADIAGKCAEAGITRQALVLVGNVLEAGMGSGSYEKSKLYDPGFSHGYRAGRSYDGGEDGGV